jgi:hypothetical protein
MERKWYFRFRWFFTSSGKLVIGGKSAEQNEDVIKNYLYRNDLVLHTVQPGSPFAVVKAGSEKITADDIHEAAVFCASFSRAWREGKLKVGIHIFKPEQITKETSKLGTFIVLGKVQKANAELKLALAIQKGRLRAVPLTAAKEIICTIIPGKISKEKTAEIISKRLRKSSINVSNEEVLNALPVGKFRITG